MTTSPDAAGLAHRLLSRIRPVAADRAAGVSGATLVGWYTRKALLPLIRGLLRRPTLRSARGLLFVGGRVRIQYPRMLTVGKHCALGGGTVVNAYSRDGVTLGDRVTIGLASVVEIGVDAGPDCQVGALSLVPKHITLDGGATYAGIPVRRLR